MSGFSRVLVPVVFGLLLLLASKSVAETVKFVVLGDIPYGEHQSGRLAEIGNTLRQQGFPFAIHYGDVKSGTSPCNDALLLRRRNAIYGLIEGPVFFTPGDNDWTDCDREAAGGFDELERLKLLRSIFFADDLPSNPELRITRQSAKYPENARWEYGGLQFVTLHFVGTSNGRLEILKSDVDASLNAVDERDAANLEWLDAAFDQARQRNLDGVIVVIHADPLQDLDRTYRKQPCTQDERTQCNPFLTFLQRLTGRADALDRPVLLVHGSTMSYCLDRGFGGWPAPKLWRLNGPGDYTVIDASVISFNRNTADGPPFRVRGLLSKDAVSNCSLQ